MESRDASADSPSEALIRDLLRLAREGANGQVIYQPAEGREQGKVVLEDGRVVDASYQNEWGWQAFKELLASTSGTFSFVGGERQEYPERVSGSTVSLLIECLESLNEERKGRRGR